jgi:hypothetical protein
MGISDIVAIIGAAAWLPHIIRWISNYLKKPKLQVISAQSLAIGSDTWGPWIHFVASISSERKDAIVTNIDLIVKHQSGEVQTFGWENVQEPQFNFQLNSGPEEGMFVKKLAVRAIKAIQETLIERRIFFRRKGHGKEVNEKINTLKENSLFLSKSSPSTATSIIESKEHAEADRFLKDGIFWREGKYSVEAIFTINNLRKPHIEHFEFYVSRRDQDAIDKNRDLISDFLKKFVNGDDCNQIPWNHVEVDVQQ